jgi:hypothetical protein
MQYGTTPAHEGHARLRAEVESYLAETGFWVENNGYEGRMAPEIVQHLMRTASAGAQAVRGEADLIAVHADLDATFAVEVKSHSSDRYADLCIEFIPLAQHAMRSLAGYDCLYACEVAGREIGFWASKLPAIRAIYLPMGTSEAKAHLVDNLARLLCPAARVVRGGRDDGGSGDPFVVVGAEELAEMPDWRFLVRDRLDEAAHVGAVAAGYAGAASRAWRMYRQGGE